MNNKGFAITGTLYALLIIFFLVLILLLSNIKNNTNLVSSANNDIINGESLFADVVELDGNKQVRIKSRYGVMYFPKDFTTDLNDNNTCINGEIKVTLNSNVEISCDYLEEDGTYKITDTLLEESSFDINVGQYIE